MGAQTERRSDYPRGSLAQGSRCVMTRLDSHAFGRAVRVVRARANLTQKDLARHCRVRAQSISDIEQGRVNPSLRTIDAIAAAVHMSASDLLAEAERLGGALNHNQKTTHHQADFR